MLKPILRRLSTVTSTQEVARGLPLGWGVVADVQTEGRGRLGRRWEAPPGTALLASFVLPPHPLASLTAGVAAAEACGRGVRLKWPNDLLLNGAKVGGILVEAPAGRSLVGIGINLTWAPPGAAMLGAERDALLRALGETLTAWWARPPGDVAARWRELSDTIGRRVRVELPGETVSGLAESLDEDGALVVSGRRITAGDVVHVRPDAG